MDEQNTSNGNARMPNKPGLGWLIAAIVALALGAWFFYMGVLTQPYSGWLLDILIGCFVILIGIFLGHIYLDGVKKYKLA